MSKPKIYIDGQAGTTGLEIMTRLKERDDIELLIINDEDRHNDKVRSEFMNEADLVFLCLPDAAAIEAVNLVTNRKTKIIDASTAHRTASGWVYGLPELSDHFRNGIRRETRIANPGCHATGFISIVYPLIKGGILSKSEPIAAYSLTGYSGGGKKMIAEYEAENRDISLSAPGLYGLGMAHKHQKEMQTICGLHNAPLFVPVVDDYYRGMATSIMIEANADEIRKYYESYYTTGMITVQDGPTSGKIYANEMANKDSLKIIVNGRKEQTIITALFDNLGKGACGAAIQNMNIMLGFDEDKGLVR